MDTAGPLTPRQWEEALTRDGVGRPKAWRREPQGRTCVPRVGGSQGKEEGPRAGSGELRQGQQGGE